VLDEQVTQRGDDRHAATAGATLRLAGVAVAVHAPLDADEAVGQVDVAPDESAELTAAQASVEPAAPVLGSVCIDGYVA
jgi:hypothetical protein